MRKIAATLFVLGGLALLVTAGREVADARLAQQTLQVQVEQAVSPPLLAAEPLPAPAATPHPTAARQFRQGEPLFRLEIPTIGVRNVVVYGSSDAALKVAPGLIEGTALPGAVGNAVIAGHRDYYFWRLNEVAPGDPLYATTPDGTLAYVVKEKRIVPETDTSILDQTPYQQITVITCWPLIFAGRSPERLIITAVAVMSGQNGESEAYS